eukprot:TRINITY_DN70577_c0_g1_i1.p1 TRINITY_DN70577_c0_g1~~TRINITY_DN70577_c0_g1_i1.p1  ORF type:complete len:768 (+),score=156.42 TRINITY_DN70577_c0_g1_i1:109-2412(+)
MSTTLEFDINTSNGGFLECKAPRPKEGGHKLTDLEGCRSFEKLRRDLPALRARLSLEASAPLYLPELDLAHHDLGDRAIRSMVDAFVRGCVHVGHVQLFRNRLGDAAAQALAQLLVHSPAPGVYGLHISHNFISPAGVSLMLSAAAFSRRYPMMRNGSLAPLWLRVERQLCPWTMLTGQPVHEQFRRAELLISQKEARLMKRFKESGGPIANQPPGFRLLCLPRPTDTSKAENWYEETHSFRPTSPCNTGRCAHANEHGPMVHLPYFWAQCGNIPHQPEAASMDKKDPQWQSWTPKPNLTLKPPVAISCASPSAPAAVTDTPEKGVVACEGRPEEKVDDGAGGDSSGGWFDLAAQDMPGLPEQSVRTQEASSECATDKKAVERSTSHVGDAADASAISRRGEIECTKRRLGPQDFVGSRDESPPPKARKLASSPIVTPPVPAIKVAKARSEVVSATAEASDKVVSLKIEVSWEEKVKPPADENHARLPVADAKVVEEVKEEMKQEVKEELKEEMKDEVKAEVKEEKLDEEMEVCKKVSSIEPDFANKPDKVKKAEKLDKAAKLGGHEKEEKVSKARKRMKEETVTRRDKPKKAAKGDKLEKQADEEKIVTKASRKRQEPCDTEEAASKSETASKPEKRQQQQQKEEPQQETAASKEESPKQPRRARQLKGRTPSFATPLSSKGTPGLKASSADAAPSPISTASGAPPASPCVLLLEGDGRGGDGGTMGGSDADSASCAERERLVASMKCFDRLRVEEKLVSVVVDLD